MSNTTKKPAEEAVAPAATVDPAELEARLAELEAREAAVQQKEEAIASGKPLVGEDGKIAYEIFSDGSAQYSGTLTVTINGHRETFQRGEEIRVTPAQYEVLERSRHQDGATTKTLLEMEQTFSDMAAARGIE